MGGQEIGALALVAAALLYLVLCARRRRRSGTCCGEPDCPAARRTARRLHRARRGS